MKTACSSCQELCAAPKGVRPALPGYRAGYRRRPIEQLAQHRAHYDCLAA
jgi:hypothetical protein